MRRITLAAVGTGAVPLFGLGRLSDRLVHLARDRRRWLAAVYVRRYNEAPWLVPKRACG